MRNVHTASSSTPSPASSRRVPSSLPCCRRLEASMAATSACSSLYMSWRLSSGTVSTRWILPSRIQMMRSAKNLSPTSCVTITSVTPWSLFKSVSSFITMLVFTVSRSPVGSSSSKTLGLLAMARAIVTRCCSPPESCAGRWSTRSSMPTAASSSIARARRSSRDSSPRRIIGISTFSRAVKDERRLKVWNTKPRCFRRRRANSSSVVWFVIRTPFSHISPLVGLSIVPMTLRRDVFPPPDVPKMQTNSPFRTDSDTPRRAGTPSMPRR
mmetsp:Transcript_21754/g.54708  ORF Transcript_21754/g.54708 Transcript_21754/m.54708 type:complete len:269 (+) Transcript_21754:645-1451(+)